ncbi:Mlf [Symbiodinium sp. CCMP2592]|nr:Mlf [Symbiodinium sp. CCMP2592]
MEAFVQKGDWKHQRQPLEEKVPDAQSVALAIQGYTTRSFMPSVAQKVVPQFLQKLPDAFKQTSTPLLDDKERFHISKTKAVSWQEFCNRAVMYFDIRLAGMTAMAYSSHVFNTLSELHPRRSGALKAVATLVQRVDAESPNLLTI